MSGDFTDDTMERGNHGTPKCQQAGMVGGGVEFTRTRRITGYLVGGLSRFNNAKRAEEHDRVKHGVEQV